MSPLWLCLIGFLVTPIFINLTAAWIVMLMDNEKENDDGVHRGTDQEVHGSATGSSSGNQPTGTSVAVTAAQGNYTISQYAGLGAGYPIATGIAYGTQGTSGLSYQQLLYQQAMMRAQTGMQAAQPSIYGNLGGGYVTWSNPGNTNWYTVTGAIGRGGTGTLSWSYNTSVGRQSAPTRKPIKNEGIRMGEIVAYRCWPIKNGFLWSTAAGRAWAPGEPMKAGENHIRDGLGVYAFKDMSRVIQNMNDVVGVGYGEGVAFGSISLWGEIIEHEIGYRAQCAAIRSIDFVRGGKYRPHNETLIEVRALYKVEGK